MAKGLPESFRASRRYQEFHRNFREAHNELFSHAVSDWAFGIAFGSVEGEVWRPALGPNHDADAIKQAAIHFMPLYLWLLVDCAEFAAAVCENLQGREAVDALLDRYREWRLADRRHW